MFHQSNKYLIKLFIFFPFEQFSLLFIILFCYFEVVVNQSVCFLLFLFQKHKKCVFCIVLAFGTDCRLVMADLFDLLHESIVFLLNFFEFLIALVYFEQLLLIRLALVDKFACRIQTKQVIFGKTPLLPQIIYKFRRQSHVGLVVTINFPNGKVRMVVYICSDVNYFILPKIDCTTQNFDQSIRKLHQRDVNDSCYMVHIDLIECLVILVFIIVLEISFEIFLLALKLGRRDQVDRFGELGDDLADLFVVSDLFVSPSLQRHFNRIHYF